MLLDRDTFRERVLKRDDHKCVICDTPAKDAHHILERKLFPDGGYYINNGASLCETHHIEAEMTLLPCDIIREKAKIGEIVLPSHLYPENNYDKWGNTILPNGTRVRGELFFDSSVQKILRQSGVLDKFVTYVKYPRTYHLPWSESVGRDDRVMATTEQFEGKRVIATIKLDGENTTMYSDYIHARSLDSRNHPSRNWVKNFHSKIMADIPEGWRICGENVYAKHSIHYHNLRSLFYAFSVWNERNICLSWDETLEWFELLEIEPVPIIYDAIYNEERIKELCKSYYGGDECEGYVTRTAGEFSLSEFKYRVGKYVRERHVQTHGFWMRAEMVKNQIEGESR